jgi:two-component system sensor histidine kinase KdpD
MSASETINDDNVSSVETKKELAGEIHVAAERLNRLVENLLDMTRLESGLIQPKLDWCDVHDLMNTTVRKMAKELSRHSVVVDSASEVLLVKIDFALLEQVLANLLLNASQYTPPGSEILLKAYQDGNDCVITISDNGPGFPPEFEGRIFEKFYRLPGSMAGGTGLGLSIARGFVEAHKGSIKAENRVEGGTRFTIRLPLEPRAGKEAMV